MSDNTTISFVRDNMEQGEFLSFVGGGLLKALGSVIVIISAFIATSYLFSLQNDLVNLNLIICIVVFISVYIRVAEISAFKEFFITDKFNFDSNLLSLVTAQLVSWITTVGFNIASR